MSACEILSLYSDVNQRCVEFGKSQKKEKSREFIDLTRIMCEIRELLKKISVKLDPPSFREGGEEILITFWNLYS